MTATSGSSSAPSVMAAEALAFFCDLLLLGPEGPAPLPWACDLAAGIAEHNEGPLSDTRFDESGEGKEDDDGRGRRNAPFRR